MSTNFPGAVDDGTTLPNPGANAPTNNPSLSGGQTNQNDAIKAIEAKVGTGASTPTASKVFRGTGSGTSAWGQLVLTTDVTGTLPVANGGTGVTTLTVPASGILVGTTDAQDVSNKTLHDTFMGTVFNSQSATFRSILLDSSVDYLVTQLVEIGAAFSLEVPATSTLEIKPFLEAQGFASAQHDHSSAAGGGGISQLGLPLGSVVQVVVTQTSVAATGTTIMPFDDTIPQNTEGDQYMSLTITPKATTNHLLITVNAWYSHSAANDQAGVALFQDTTVNALAAAEDYENVATAVNMTNFTYDMAAGTTSPTTFKVRIGSQNAGTLTFNGQSGARRFGGAAISSITIMEYKA